MSDEYDTPEETEDTGPQETGGPAEFAVAASVDTTPRGDLVNSLIDLVELHGQARLVVVADPLSKAKAPLIIKRDTDGNQTVEALPAKVFDDYLPNPRFRRGSAAMTSLDSFIDHVIRFKDSDSAVFACDDRTKPSLTAVLDYSPGEGEAARVTAAPRHGRHRTTYSLPTSDEWKAWNESNGQPMKMAEFAAFIEDRIVDVLQPGEVELSEEAQKFINLLGGADRIATPSDLIVLSKGLTVHESSVVNEARNLASGEGEITFASEHVDKTGAPLRVPTTFQIGVPVFRNGPRYAVIARLRYRKTPTGLVFFYELWRTDRTFDHAFGQAVERVEEQTGLPVFLGAPEA